MTEMSVVAAAMREANVAVGWATGLEAAAEVARAMQKEVEWLVASMVASRVEVQAETTVGLPALGTEAA